jgi:hypothetical protein
MIEGIGRDKISDLTTNVIRSHLVAYTREQCQLHGIECQRVPLAPQFDPHRLAWIPGYAELPVFRERPIVLVPKAFVRRDPAYEHRRYYRHHVLEFLREDALSAGSALVRSLKNGKKVVYVGDLEREFPCTKEFLFRFSREHQEVLHEYRDSLVAMEAGDRTSDVDPEDDPIIARALSEALGAIEPGSERAGDYHRLMVGVVEFLFFPHLLYPRKELEIHQGRKRIDIVMENGAKEGVFNVLPVIRRLPCAYVMFECKNYVTEVGNPEIDQLAGRFSVQRGQAGILCCRRFEDRTRFVERCRDTFRDGRGLILPLEDDRVRRLLGLVEIGRRGEVDREVSDLIGEIWMA